METLCYFYHSDHPDYLGSTSWVTDSAKNGVQYCEYLPFGEPLVDQRSTTWSSRYTFSGKERDSETGYSYFGARYYHPDLSIWLSVDPMAEERPSLSPYSYCQNNPIIRTDPTGALDRTDGYTDGQGNYKWFDNHTEASFIEGNTTWNKVTNNRSEWNEATTIRDAVITGLVILGNNEESVKKDVELFSGDSPLFTKEVKLNNAEKYTSDWEPKFNSNTRRKDAFQSENLSNTGYALKFYNTKGNLKNANAIGIINSNRFDHFIEGGLEMGERLLFGSKADKDPISDMHYGNAKRFLNSLNTNKTSNSSSISNWTDVIYYKTGGRK